jgi:very-short-patch-repair endonuclease
MYTGMKFNSPPEVEIAKALERKGIMYLANCLVRVGTSNNRSSIYPDFLIFHNNKIGWLEVDGQTYHTPRNATQDHARSRAVEIHGGIDYFTRYDANKCRNDPDGVVEEFLKILNKK